MDLNEFNWAAAKQTKGFAYLRTIVDEYTAEKVYLLVAFLVETTPEELDSLELRTAILTTFFAAGLEAAALAMDIFRLLLEDQ
jgi:hypothetical protein